MRVDLDARVQTRDGEDIGTVDRAVIDPRNNELTDFLIRTGEIFGRDILVPRTELENASRDGDVLRLDLSKASVDDLPTYNPGDYSAPPAEWEPPPAYGYPAPGYLWPTGANYPIRPVSPPPPPGGPSLVSLNKGAPVVDRSGDQVGVVEDVQLDPANGRLQGFIMRIGGPFLTLFGGGETAEIGSDLIAWVEEEVVHLRVDKDKIRRSGG